MPNFYNPDARISGLRSAVHLAILFGVIKVSLHLVATLWSAHLGYGYFRDEFYYLICGRHLAWGYVDHGPGVAVQARLAEILFGTSIPGIRIFSAIAGAAAIFLSGILAWSLGGHRAAQSLAMLGILVAPEYLEIDSYLSMNSAEPIFWMLCTLAIIRLLSGANPRCWWLTFGASAGVGLLNKPSMAFFLIALLLGLLLTPQRRVLLNRWTVVAAIILLVVALPNLLWQIQNHWPTLEFLRNGRIRHKNVELTFLPFLRAQVDMMHPLNVLLWITGIVSLLRERSLLKMRWIALTYLIFFAMMFRLHAKDYYLAAVYPVLFAAGAIAWERRFTRGQSVPSGSFAFPVYRSLLIFTGVLLLPLALPVLPPYMWIRYTSFLHLRAGNTENQIASPLPQFYADRFGWQQYLDLVNTAYRSLPPKDRLRVVLYADNYGEAGAIDFLGSREHLNLPAVISGHNNYWLWGTHDRYPDLVIAISGGTPGQLQREYNSATLIGTMDDPLAMPYEHKHVYLLSGRRSSAPFVWDKKKDFI